MLLYHYLTAEFGLDDVAKNRIRVSQLSDLNDPFEFLALKLPDRKFRRKFLSTKSELHKSTGLICLSESWQNPVMWSHYADKHRGVCLGFEVSTDLTVPVQYELDRLGIDPTAFLNSEISISEDAMRKCLSTKFHHWEYEKEQRVFVNLDDCEKDFRGNYFSEFGPQFKLMEIVIGPNSKVSRNEIDRAIGRGRYEHKINLVKARLAFNEFKVVVQRNAKLWR